MSFRVLLYAIVSLGYIGSHNFFNDDFWSVLGSNASQDIPSVTRGMHSKIASGSSLIQINCSSSQGRFLKVGFVCIYMLCANMTQNLTLQGMFTF